MSNKDRKADNGEPPLGSGVLLPRTILLRIQNETGGRRPARRPAPPPTPAGTIPGWVASLRAQAARADAPSATELAAQYEVSVATVYNVLRNTTHHDPNYRPPVRDGRRRRRR